MPHMDLGKNCKKNLESSKKLHMKDQQYLATKLLCWGSSSEICLGTGEGNLAERCFRNTGCDSLAQGYQAIQTESEDHPQ